MHTPLPRHQFARSSCPAAALPPRSAAAGVAGAQRERGAAVPPSEGVHVSLSSNSLLIGAEAVAGLRCRSTRQLVNETSRRWKSADRQRRAAALQAPPWWSGPARPPLRHPAHQPASPAHHLSRICCPPPASPAHPFSCSCCDLSRNAHELWVAWTVAGVLGFVLALMCSAALVHDMLAMRRQRVRGTGPSAGAGWLRRWTAANAAPCIVHAVLLIQGTSAPLNPFHL